MYDIEVIDGESYGVISQGSPAYEFLKAMNSKLVLKKLASQPGEEIFLSASEAVSLCRGFQTRDLIRLKHVGLLEISTHVDWNMAYSLLKRGTTQRYNFTPYGLEVMAHLKAHGGDIEILL